MSDKNNHQDTQNADGKESSAKENQTWMQRNFPALFGGGAFALLGVLTLIMYLLNN